MNDVKVYGADWCGDTMATREYLDSVGVTYEYLNVDEDTNAEAWVKAQNGGKQKLPTLDLAGQILVMPDEGELEDALRGKGLIN
jgi:glutaredoxin